MDHLLKLGIIGCTAASIYAGYLQIQAILDAVKMSRLDDGKTAVTEPELSAIEFRQKNCEHDWSTCLHDNSKHTEYDDFLENIEGCSDGTMYYRCERCKLEEGYLSVGINLKKISHGNRSVPGRLSLKEFARRLVDQSK